MELRNYQSQAITDIVGETMFGSNNIVLEAPTGSGKSVIISELCNKLDGNIVVMVNITPLIDQISLHLNEMGIDHSILKAGYEDHYNQSHRVQLVMSQTFYSRADEIDICCDYLIIDERHREYDTQRTTLLINKLKPTSVIGLTATPYDQAGYALKDSNLIQSVTVKELTEQGFLSPVKYYVPKWSTDLGLEDLRMSGSDYSGSAIDEKFSNDEYYSRVVESMNQMDAKNKKTLVFCNSIEQCETINSLLINDGYNSNCIHSKKSNIENDTILNSFRNNTDTKCLVSVSKLNIGFDVRDIELGVMLRPTKVRSLYIQTVGRLTRTSEGKSHAEFLDLAGTVMEHGFHDEIYFPPEAGDKHERMRVGERASAEEIKHIVSEEPTEVDRVKVNVFIQELREKQQKAQKMSINDLVALFDMTNDLYMIIDIAFKIQQIKTGAQYKSSTVQWIADHWEEVLEDNYIYRTKWIRALKTRAKNIVRDSKKLASLYYFVDFLEENIGINNY